MDANDNFIPKRYEELPSNVRRRKRSEGKYIRNIFLCIAVVLGVIICFAYAFLYQNQKNSSENSFLRIFDNGAGAVCSESSVCSVIGRDILEKSDNAIDAAISTLFCNGLTNMAGLGGGFSMLLYRREYEQIVGVDTEATNNSGSEICIPGDLKGYLEAHERYGSHLSWADIIRPTYELCSRGFSMGKALHAAAVKNIKKIYDDPILKNIFLEGESNSVKTKGSVIKPPSSLCETLKILMENGPNALYVGSLADDFQKDVKEVGGNVTKGDLKAYRARITKPLKMNLRKDVAIYTTPEATGKILTFMLKLIDYKASVERMDMKNLTADLAHYTIETFKHGFAMQGQLYKTDSKNISDKLNSQSFVEEIYSRIEPEKTFPAEEYGDGNFVSSEHRDGYSHVSVIAPNGDAVSVTSHNYFTFGRVGQRTGISLNGILIPGCKAVSSFATPVITADENGSVKFVLGSSGGTYVLTSLINVLTNILWREMDIKNAVDAKRIHHQLLPGNLFYEVGYSQEIVQRLKNMGYNVTKINSFESSVCLLENADRTLYGYADGRTNGDVSGYSFPEEKESEES